MTTRKIKFLKADINIRFILLPFVLAAFLLAFLLIYRDIKARTIDEFSNEQLILAKTASQGIISFFDNTESGLIFLSEFMDIVKFEHESKKLMTSFFMKHQEVLAAITRVDADGNILYTYPDQESVIGENISYQKHIHEVKTKHEPIISDVFLSEQGYLAIALHVPIFDESEFAGSLAILISIDKLGKLYLDEINLRGNGTVWLLSEEGIELYCPVTGHTGHHFLEMTQSDTIASLLLNRIKTELNGTLKTSILQKSEDISKNTKDNYIAFCRVPLGNTYWTIMISSLEEDIYLSISQLRNRLILVFSVLFLFISYYFYSLFKVRKFITEASKRKKAENILRESEEKFRRLFEDHAAVKLLIDPDSGAIVDANYAAERYYGWKREELKEMNIGQINASPPGIIEKELNKVRSKKKIHFEFSHRKKNGTVRDVEVFSSMIRIGDMDLLHSIVHDISDRKLTEKALVKAKEKAVESDLLKSAFLANMSHEIRTPMNGILGFTDLLKEPDLTSEEQQKYISIIEKSGARMLYLINNIINISKIEAGQMEVSISECNVNQIINDLTVFFKPETEQKGVDLKVQKELPDEAAILLTDGEKIQAVLINLIKNAINYTREGEISFGYTSTGNDLEFYVKDTGAGIPKNRQEAIFERFIQADIKDKMAYQGAGLGLSISKAYIELLDSKLTVESETGKGSLFKFALPYNDKNNSSFKSEIKKESSYKEIQLPKLKILIVEDDISSEVLLEEIFLDFNLNILKARNGFEALRICREQKDIDIILMDIKLPRMDGYETTRKIRTFNDQVYIIALTAYALVGDREKALMSGCNDYITKPLDRKVLLEKIRDAKML